MLQENQGHKTEVKNCLSCDPGIDLVATVVSAIFRQFGWEYHDGMPGHERLQATIGELASSLIVNKGEYTECGRMMLTRDENVVHVYVHAGEFTIPYGLLDPRESESANSLPEAQ